MRVYDIFILVLGKKREVMVKKRKVVLKKTVLVETPSTEWLLRGLPVSVGTEVMIKHYSSASWIKAEIKEIKLPPSGIVVYYFFIVKPGWIALNEDRVRFIPTKKKKREKQ